jgi:Flp pilus assembly protein TadG
MWQRMFADDRASQMVEFAVSLPLLVVFIVGIFDFSGAFTLKQKLANAAREGARAAAAGPANDLGGPSAPATVPVSVGDAIQVVDGYLTNAKVDDCGLSSAIAAPNGTLTWQYASTGGTCAAGGITVIINRGFYFSQTAATPATSCVLTPGGGPATAVIATCVSIQYAYSWRFDRVVRLLGSTSSVPSSMTTIAVAMNEN